jgi:hypothetical protein
MSNSMAGDSVYTDCTDGTNGTNITAYTYTTAGTAYTDGTVPAVIKKSGWFDAFWACILDEDLEKETEETKKAKARAEQQQQRRSDDDTVETDAVSEETRETDPWAFLQGTKRQENQEGLNERLFRSERERQEFLDFQRWKSSKEFSLGGISLGDDDEEDSVSITPIDSDDSRYLGHPRRRHKGERRRSMKRSSHRFQDRSFDTYESDDLSTVSHEDDEDEPARHSKRWDRFGSGRRHHHSYSGNKRETRASRSRLWEMREASPRRDSHLSIKGRRRAEGRQESRELPPRPPRDANRKMTATGQTPTGNEVNEKQISQDGLGKNPPTKARTMKSKHQDPKGGNENAMMRAIDVVEDTKKDKIDVQHGKRSPDEKGVFSYGSLLFRKSFAVPKLRRAHSFDSVQVNASPTSNISLHQGPLQPKRPTDFKGIEKTPSGRVSTDEKEEIPRQSVTITGTTPHESNRKERGESEQGSPDGKQEVPSESEKKTEAKRLPIPPPENKLHGDVISSRLKDSVQVEAESDNTGQSSNSRSDSPGKDDEQQQQIYLSPSQSSLRSTLVANQWKGGAIFHSSSMSQSYSVPPSMEQRDEVSLSRPPLSPFSIPSSTMSCDGHLGKEISSGVHVPPRYSRKQPNGSNEDRSSHKEPKKGWKPGFLTRARSIDFGSAASVDRKHFRYLGSRVHGGHDASSVC